jgi:predicted ATP-grasp superfamily ATP-dependent carboligase
VQGKGSQLECRKESKKEHSNWNLYTKYLRSRKIAASADTEKLPLSSTPQVHCINAEAKRTAIDSVLGGGGIVACIGAVEDLPEDGGIWQET